MNKMNNFVSINTVDHSSCFGKEATWQNVYCFMNKFVFLHLIKSMYDQNINLSNWIRFECPNGE